MLSDVDDVIVFVGEHLQLDVLGVLEIAFGIDRAVFEIRLGFAASRGVGRIDFVQRVRDPEAFAAAARRRLERERQPESLRRLARRRDVGDRVGRAGHDRHVRLAHRLPSPQLIAHRVDCVGMRSDPDQSRRDDAARERGVLCEKAVSGMNRLRARASRAVDELYAVEITPRRCRRPDVERFVGHLDVQRVAVGVGIDRDRRDPHLARRADDAHRDLAAVRDE